MSVSLSEVRQNREQAKKRRENLINKIFMAVSAVLIVAGAFCVLGIMISSPATGGPGAPPPRMGFGGGGFVFPPRIAQPLGGFLMILAGAVGIYKGRQCYRSYYFVGLGILAFWQWLMVFIGILSQTAYRGGVVFPVFIVGAAVSAVYLGMALYRNSVLPRKARGDVPEY